MTVIEKPQAWPASLPHLVTEVPGPKALAQVAADQAVVSNSLPRLSVCAGPWIRDGR
jgi:hypothetical protein